MKTELREQLKDLGFDVDALDAEEEPSPLVESPMPADAPGSSGSAFTERREREARARICAKITRGKWEAHLEKTSAYYANTPDVHRHPSDVFPGGPPDGLVCSMRLGAGPVLL